MTTMSTIKTPPGAKTSNWMKDAACLRYDPEWWFPEPHEDDKKRKAVRICKECPVRRQCLMWGFVTDDRWAILGGLTIWQRTSIRHRLERAGKWTRFITQLMAELYTPPAASGS